MTRTILPLLLLGAACRPVKEAPPELDALILTFWNEWETASDEEIRGYAEDLVDVIDFEALDQRPIDGSMSYLDQEGVDRVEKEFTGDPDTAHPMFLVNRFACTSGQLEPILYHLDQNALYPVYDRYDRVYTSDDAAYLDRSERTLSWDVELETSFILSKYTEWLSGGIRYVEDGDDPILLTRTWITRHSEFAGDANAFDQDYQVEVYFRHGGSMLHLYGLWRDMKIGSYTTEDTTVSRPILNKLAEWDDQTAALCAEGKP